MSSRLGVNASPEVCGDSGATSPLCAAGTLYTAALTALYVSLSKDGPDLCYSGRATQWEFLANSYGATGEEDFCVSVCSATDSLWISDVLLLGSKSEEKKKKQSESAHQRGKEKKIFFFEEDKSPVHKEVINICMTEQMTAYFHGNALVSPEMSAGDRSRLLWASVWLLTESPAPLDCRSQNTSKLEREREFTQVIVSALMWTRCHCCFFLLFSRKTRFIHLQI